MKLQANQMKNMHAGIMSFLVLRFEWEWRHELRQLRRNRLHLFPRRARTSQLSFCHGG